MLQRKTSLLIVDPINNFVCFRGPKFFLVNLNRRQSRFAFGIDYKAAEGEEISS
jgi:hypothetical protein